MSSFCTSSSPHACYVDATAANVIQQVVEASQFTPEDFRYLHIRNRLPIAKDSTAVGFQYFRYGIGGGEKVTYYLMELFRKQGRHVVLYIDERVESEEELALPEGVSCKLVPLEPSERVAFWANEIETEKLCCVVYGTWLSPRAPLDCLAIQTSGAAFVFETHGTATCLFDFPNNKESWDNLLRCAYAADLMVCLSESDRLFWETYNANVRCVLNPLDPHIDEPLTSEEKAPHYDVVFCGRLHTQDKRPDEALRVFAAARKRLPSIRMAFVGDGPAHEKLELLSKELGVGNAVDFLGFKANPRSLVQNAGVLVLTSPSEGYALVLAEAACLGTPCVVYELPHLATLRGNGGAIQVPQGDWETAGQAVAMLLSDEELYARTAQAGRQFYETALQTNLSLTWSKILDDALAAAGRAHIAPQPSDDPVRALVFNAVAASRRQAIRCQDFEDRMNSEWHRANTAEEELRALRASRSFRLGQALAWLPRMLRGHHE